MKTICIDESGTLGFGSHEPYFVMAALMIDDEKAIKRMKNLIRRVNASAMHQLQLANQTQYRNYLHIDKNPRNPSFYDSIPSLIKQRAQRHIVTSLSARADHRLAYTVVDKTVWSSVYQYNRHVRHKIRQRILCRLIRQWA